jgi:hypothetical protein
MATLTEEQQAYIVTALACCVKPKTIVEEAKQRWGIELPPSQISYYDPTNPISGRHLADEWRVLFHATREAYIARERAIPIAIRTYRLEVLTELLDHDLVKAAPTLKASILEQAAKEVGGLYETRVSAKDAEDFVAQMGEDLKAAVEKFVTNPQERDRVKDQIQKLLAGQSKGADS